MSAIPVNKWKWFGLAGHFIGASHCRFHMCTQVGKYLISSVGNYYPNEGKRNTIGAGNDAFFETYVFKAGVPCDEKGCNCGMPDLADASELDGSCRAATAGEARANHMRLCRKYARTK